MSIITTTRSFQRGDNFTFTVAAKNGYGINYHEIPSMSEYLVEDSEIIEPIGAHFPGSYNLNLYPGVRISGTLNDTSVNYDILLNNSGAVHQLAYVIKFTADSNPITGNSVEIQLDGIPGGTINPYMWSPEPLILPTPQIVITEPESSDIYFTVWHCTSNNTDYAAGSRIYVNDNMFFEAKWGIIPVSVSVESDTDNSDVPEFEENE